MARARNIKPGFFTNDVLAECEPGARLVFIGLWCIADREGRLEDRPARIRAQVAPYDDCNVSLYLDQLAQRSFIVRYEVGGRKYIQINNFVKHQSPHIKEPASTIPAPDLSGANSPDCGLRIADSGLLNVESRVSCSDFASQSAEPAKAKRKPKANPANYKFPVWPCSGGSETAISTWTLEQWQIDGWREAFPGIDVEAECRRAHAWIIANMSRRKTADGMTRFLFQWLSKEQNRAGNSRPPERHKPKPKARAVPSDVLARGTYNGVTGWTPHPDDAAEWGDE